MMEDCDFKDGAARTTRIGLFHYANSYRISARVLNANRPKVTHPDEPVNFLFYQAVELFLKAFLLLHGHSSRELASRPRWLLGGIHLLQPNLFPNDSWPKNSD
jgi:hypothetical protein